MAKQPMTQPSSNSSEFAKLYAGGQSRLFAFICSLVGSYDLASEVLQETNVVMWEKQHEFTIGTNFTAWSFRIARYQVMAMREKQSRDRLVFSDDMLDRIAAESSAFSEQYEQRQGALDFCLAKLPDKQHDLIRRRYMHGESVKQIASQVGRSANTIGVRLHRVRTALMKCIDRQLRQDQGGQR